MKLKKYLIVGSIGLILLTAVVVLSYFLIRQIRETNRLHSNYTTELIGDHSTQQTITKAELKKYFADLNTKLKQYGIKAGQVQNVINIQYHYIDTLIPRDTLIYVYDTISHLPVADFDIQSKCHRITGCISNNTIEIDRIETTDSILISLYREKRCLFNHRIKVIAISSCKGDTLQILRNLKIQRKYR